MEYRPILGHMIYVARKAGEIIMYTRENGFGHSLNHRGGASTTADERVKAFVREKTTQRFPGCGLLTEESRDSLERLDMDCVFIVDEVDGSRSFARGEDQFSFMMAYVVKGVPIMGIISEPQKGRMIYGVKGELVEIKEGIEFDPLRLKEGVSLDNYVVNYHSSNFGITRVLELPEERVQEVSSMGTMMTRLAMGETDVVIGDTRGLNEWDVAAGQVILEELGFKVGDLKGREFTYNKERPNMGREGIVIAHPAIADDIPIRDLRI